MKFEKTELSIENDPEYQKRFESWNRMEEYFSGPGGKDSEDYEDDDVFYDSEDSFFEKKEDWIDGRIRELVIGLNLIGAKTTLSCEGHFENIYKIDSQGLEGAWTAPYVGFYLGIELEYPYGKKEWQTKDEKVCQRISKIQSLIDEFYQDRKVSPEISVRLQKDERYYCDYWITLGNADACEWETVSGVKDYQELEEMAKEKLINEQQEMSEFSGFLKKKYLEAGFYL
jgi:hypothetical protein